MIEDLSKEQLQGVLEAIPAEISFVDENDLVKFSNKHEMRIFGRPVCAPGKSVRHKAGKYLGALEATQDITKIGEIEGKKGYFRISKGGPG